MARDALWNLRVSCGVDRGMMRVWIPGGRGMLGHDLCALLRARGHEALPTSREVDIADGHAVESFVVATHPTHVINCAAHTGVDACESEETQALRANRDGAAHVGAVARAHGLGALHVSTDYVFRGDANVPYRETDAPDPVSVYGRSKLAGERAFMAATEGRGAVVRTSWLFGAHGRSFPTTMLRLMAERDEVRVVADQHGRPTYTADLARALIDLLEGRAEGTWHFANAGATTWHGFAVGIRDAAAAAGLHVRARAVTPITTADWPTPALRPPWSVLATDKITSALGWAPRPWIECLPDWLAARHALDQGR